MNNYCLLLLMMPLTFLVDAAEENPQNQFKEVLFFNESKSGDTQVTLGENKCGQFCTKLTYLLRFDDLKKNKDFIKFAFPVILSTKRLLKESKGIMSKYIMMDILEKGYPLSSSSKLEEVYPSWGMFPDIKNYFSGCSATGVFVDDNKNIFITYKDRGNINNLLYIKRQRDKNVPFVWYLAMHNNQTLENKNVSFFSTEVGNPGDIKEIELIPSKDYDVLTFKKDNRDYSVQCFKRTK